MVLGPQESITCGVARLPPASGAIEMACVRAGNVINTAMRVGGRRRNGEHFLYALAIELWKDWKTVANDATSDLDFTIKPIT